MSPSPNRNRREVKRRDALIALPLGQFRRTLPRLPDEELDALGARIEVLAIAARWARGSSHGIARHRSSTELGLLTRRAAAIRRELDSRRGLDVEPALVLLRDPVAPRLLVGPDGERQAA